MYAYFLACSRKLAKESTFVGGIAKFLTSHRPSCELESAIEDLKDYFIYVPEGYTKDTVDVGIDVSRVWETKVKAMYAYQSQIEDVKWILKFKDQLPKYEYFREAFKTGKRDRMRRGFFES